MSIYLFIPPRVNYSEGPLLGPSILASLHSDVQLIDLNIRWIRHTQRHLTSQESMIIGDHAKKPHTDCDQNWKCLMASVFPQKSIEGVLSPIKNMTYSFDEIENAVQKLESMKLGFFYKDNIPLQKPRWVGISILFSGQIPAALLLAKMCKTKYPNTPIIFGGAHITAIADQITQDTRYGTWVDGFVAGYAEKTFIEICNLQNPLQHSKVFHAGSQSTVKRADALNIIAPIEWGDLSKYGINKLHLPAQTSRGCAYGKCAFCTYPHVEGAYKKQSLQKLQTLILQARQRNAAISFKDSLLTSKRLLEIGNQIQGAVPWSACTRILPILSKKQLRLLASQGLQTLELGVETVEPKLLHLVDKRQNPEFVQQWLSNISDLSIHLILNMMTGFPTETRDDHVKMNETIQEWKESFPYSRFSVEKNIFQLQQNTTLYKNHFQYGIQIKDIYPWSTICSWNAPSWIQDITHWSGHSYLEEAA